MSLKEILNNIFEVNLPISGGYSHSINTPILLDENGPSDYVYTQHLLLKYIGILRGVSWREIEKTLLEHNGRYLHQIKIETAKFTGHDVITQIEDYYFDIDYFVRKEETEKEATETFNKEKIRSLILQRLEEMRHENDFNRKCIELLKTNELSNNCILSNEFSRVIFNDPSFYLFEAMSNITKEPIRNVLMGLAPQLK